MYQFGINGLKTIEHGTWLTSISHRPVSCYSSRRIQQCQRLVGNCFGPAVIFFVEQTIGTADDASGTFHISYRQALYCCCTIYITMYICKGAPIDVSIVYTHRIS